MSMYMGLRTMQLVPLFSGINHGYHILNTKTSIYCSINAYLDQMKDFFTLYKIKTK